MGTNFERITVLLNTHREGIKREWSNPTQKRYRPHCAVGAFLHLIHFSACICCHSSTWKLSTIGPKPLLKIGSVNKAFLFWYWLPPISYFFRNRTFLFYKIESWSFQHLFENEFREPSQNFISIRHAIEKMKITIVWIWNFVRFLSIGFQTDAESFSFLSWKTKDMF